MSTQTNERTLRIGSKGDDVEFLQRFLNADDFGPLAEDGVFGSKTEAAVKKYQSSRGLTADGIVGPKTWACITSEMN
ncbi:hypothetical protein NIES4103_23910 [Nostoc sp. NIES-4103]|nr:hypothetical protein NIES4103_23910 [Nostoc sp. NIES-4103]